MFTLVIEYQGLKAQHQKVILYAPYSGHPASAVAAFRDSHVMGMIPRYGKYAQCIWQRHGLYTKMKHRIQCNRDKLPVKYETGNRVWFHTMIAHICFKFFILFG